MIAPETDHNALKRLKRYEALHKFLEDSYDAQVLPEIQQAPECGSEYLVLNILVIEYIEGIQEQFISKIKQHLPDDVVVNFKQQESILKRKNGSPSNVDLTSALEYIDKSLEDSGYDPASFSTGIPVQEDINGQKTFSQNSQETGNSTE